jgi:hypothetical protein
MSQRAQLGLFVPLLYSFHLLLLHSYSIFLSIYYTMAPPEDHEGPAPSPKIMPSQLSKAPETSISELAVDIKFDPKEQPDLDGIVAAWRASCYIAAAQIFLR